jgi:recombination protein RecA
VPKGIPKVKVPQPRDEAGNTAAQIHAGRTPVDRNVKLLDLIAKAEKAYGKGALTTLRGGVTEKVGIISSGSISVDAILGVGGIPRGRVIEIYGPESSGKTTLTLHLIAEAQKRGGIAAFIDAEHALDPAYASSIGVDVDQLLLSQPDNGEQALNLVGDLSGSGEVDIIVIDSVAALVPKAELEGEVGDSLPGAQARMMSQALRMLTPRIHKTNCCVIFINQLRMKIGVSFGNPETTTGGNALKFYATVRVDVRAIGKLSKPNNPDEKIGNRLRVKVVKNKLAPPHRQCEVDLIFGKGISVLGEIVDLGVAKEIIQKYGAWYAYGDTRLGQGRENSMRFLEANPTIRDEIQSKIVAHGGLTTNATDTDTQESA